MLLHFIRYLWPPLGDGTVLLLTVTVKGCMLAETVFFKFVIPQPSPFPYFKRGRSSIVLNCEIRSDAALKQSTSQRLDISFHGNQGPWVLAFTAGSAADFHSSSFY